MSEAEPTHVGATADACGGCAEDLDAADAAQRRVLWILLAINAAMFVVEIVAGLLAESTGLLGDSLDMLADATVYGIALWAVGKTIAAKRRAAVVGGVFQVALATGVALDVARRAFVGSEPGSSWMMGVGLLALAANVTCFLLLLRHRRGEIHMRASWICSLNDVLANTGVILGGLLVKVTGTRWPDLVIGAAIAALVLRGGIRILQEARAPDACG